MIGGRIGLQQHPPPPPPPLVSSEIRSQRLPLPRRLSINPPSLFLTTRLLPRKKRQEDMCLRGKYFNGKERRRGNIRTLYCIVCRSYDLLQGKEEKETSSVSLEFCILCRNSEKKSCGRRESAQFFESEMSDSWFRFWDIANLHNGEKGWRRGGDEGVALSQKSVGGRGTE